jgi:hypothetical protein
VELASAMQLTSAFSSGLTLVAARITHGFGATHGSNVLLQTL